MALPEDVRQRVVSYLTHQAGKSVAGICDLIAAERSRLLALLEGLSEEQAAFPPAPGEWSIKQVVGHAASAERGVAAIVGRLTGVLDEGKGDDAPDLESGADHTLDELRTTLLQARRELLDMIAQVPGDAPLEAKHDHPFFGPLNWKDWLVFQRVHDRDHIGQIEAIQQSPAYPKGA